MLKNLLLIMISYAYNERQDATICLDNNITDNNYYYIYIYYIITGNKSEMKLAEDALLATRENTDLNNTTQPKKKPVENRKRQTNNTSTIPKKKQVGIHITNLASTDLAILHTHTHKVP